MDLELLALRRLENEVRLMLRWDWEDDCDEDCAADVRSVRRAVNDLEAARRLADSASGEDRG